jgi:hypothetical protein
MERVMRDEEDHRASGQPTPLQIFMERMKNELKDPELVKQALADFNASQRKNARNNFEARIEFGKRMAEQRRAALDGIVRYGLQTLRWSFLLNAGAIAVVLTYLGASVKASTPGVVSSASLLKALWPFAAGCVSVGLAGAAAFFNFSCAEAAIPSSEALHNFVQPGAASWPIARFQKEGESATEFYKRFGYRATLSRNIAIFFTVTSTLFFIYGVYRVLNAALA